MCVCENGFGIVLIVEVSVRFDYSLLLTDTASIKT